MRNGAGTIKMIPNQYNSGEGPNLLRSVPVVNSAAPNLAKSNFTLSITHEMEPTPGNAPGSLNYQFRVILLYYVGTFQGFSHL